MYAILVALADEFDRVGGDEEGEDYADDAVHGEEGGVEAERSRGETRECS
jgi:hypothetical protein